MGIRRGFLAKERIERERRREGFFDCACVVFGSNRREPKIYIMREERERKRF